MIEMITIKEVDSEMYIHDEIEGGAIFTNDIKHILGFGSIEEAEDFCNEYLDDTDCYEIIKLKINIGLDETILKTINY